MEQIKLKELSLSSTHKNKASLLSVGSSTVPPTPVANSRRWISSSEKIRFNPPVSHNFNLAFMIIIIDLTVSAAPDLNLR